MAKKRDIGTEILGGLREFRERPESLRRARIDAVDVRAVRDRFGMSPSHFAAFLPISVRTLQKWEQGQRRPAGAAHALLRVMQKEPEPVRRALHGRPR